MERLKNIIMMEWWYLKEYLNGMKNGKGKEYEGKLIFEGEYLNGMRNGQGKRIQ